MRAEMLLAVALCISTADARKKKGSKGQNKEAGTCPDGCISGFVENGGCKAAQTGEDPASLVPEGLGCSPALCEADAVAACNEQQVAGDCPDGCIPGFVSNGGCEALASGKDPAPFVPQDFGCTAACQSEVTEACHLHSLANDKKAPPEEHAEKGDPVADAFAAASAGSAGFTSGDPFAEAFGSAAAELNPKDRVQWETDDEFFEEMQKNGALECKITELNDGFNLNDWEEELTTVFKNGDAGGEPVVLRNHSATLWKIPPTWSDKQSFLDEFGEVHVAMRWALGARTVGVIERVSSLRDYLQIISNDTSGMIFGNPCGVMRNDNSPTYQDGKNSRCEMHRDTAWVDPKLKPFADVATTTTRLSIAPSRRGLPFHNHEASWEAITAGKKLVLLHPPISEDPGAEFYMESTLEFLRGGGLQKFPKVKPVLLEAGDIVFIPCNWWHATINIGETVAVAGEKVMELGDARYENCPADLYAEAAKKMVKGHELVDEDPAQAIELLETCCPLFKYNLVCHTTMYEALCRAQKIPKAIQVINAIVKDITEAGRLGWLGPIPVSHTYTEAAAKLLQLWPEGDDPKYARMQKQLIGWVETFVTAAENLDSQHNIKVPVIRAWVALKADGKVEDELDKKVTQKLHEDQSGEALWYRSQAAHGGETRGYLQAILKEMALEASGEADIPGAPAGGLPSAKEVPAAKEAAASHGYDISTTKASPASPAAAGSNTETCSAPDPECKEHVNCEKLTETVGPDVFETHCEQLVSSIWDGAPEMTVSTLCECSCQGTARSACLAAQDDDEPEAPLTARQYSIDPGGECKAGMVRISAKVCEENSPNSVGHTKGTIYQHAEKVPMLLKDFPKHLKRLLPWLREYIVEREAEWAALPRGQGSWDTQDSSLSARSTQYNLLDSGRTELEQERLGLIREFIGEAVAEFLVEFKTPPWPAEQDGNQDWKAMVQAKTWKHVPDAWAECWANVHRKADGDWGTKYTYLRPHSHSYPFSGYIYINAGASKTLFRSPYTKNLFTIDGQDGRLQIMPGGVQHATEPWAGDSPRLSMAFNVEFVDPEYYKEMRGADSIANNQKWTKLMGDDLVVDDEVDASVPVDPELLMSHYYSFYSVMNLYTESQGDEVGSDHGKRI